MQSDFKLLYVDDEATNLQLFYLNFRKDFEVYTATDAYEGLELLKSHSDEIVIVISDMKMPGMNGLEFIRKAKEIYPLKKYFILTGFNITPEINQAIDEGLILKCFSKPFNITEIRNAIYEVVDSE